jgi:hypothetical protein
VKNAYTAVTIIDHHGGAMTTLLVVSSIAGRERVEGQEHRYSTVAIAAILSSDHFIAVRRCPPAPAGLAPRAGRAGGKRPDPTMPGPRVW